MRPCPVLLFGLVFLAMTVLRAAPGATMPERLDLERALAFALDNNFSIRHARERLREQEGVVTSVSAGALPGVSVAGSYQQSNIATFQTGSTQNSGAAVIVPSGRYWRMNFTVRQTLYAGGGIRATIDSASLTRDAAILELKSVISEVLLDVRIRFYTILLTREDIKVQEQNLELLESQLRDVTIRVKAGAVSDFERLRAEVAVANAKPALIKARNDFRLAVEELRRVTGLERVSGESFEKIPEFAGALTFEPLKFELVAALAAARTGRPELQRLAKLLNAAEAGELTARAGYYPNLALTAGGELRKGPSERLRDSLQGLRAGVQAQWAVNSRATAGRVGQAESQIEQARLALGVAELAVQVEVRRALSSLEEAGELVGATGQSVKQAEEAVRIALIRYQAGRSTQLDLLQSQVALTTTRTNELHAIYNHNIALAQLHKATGAAGIEYMGDALVRSPPK